MTAPLIRGAVQAGRKALAKQAKSKKANALTHEEAKVEAQRLTQNIAKRAKRIGMEGIRTAAIEAFFDITLGDEPETRNEAVKRVAQLRKINADAGTFLRTAAKVKARENTAQRNARIRDRAKDPNQLMTMTRDEAIEAAKLIRRDHMARIRRTRAAVGDSFGVTRAMKTIEAMDLENGTLNAIRSSISEMIKQTAYKTLTPSGAKAVEDRTTDIFGPEYKNYTTAEQSALWDAMGDLMKAESKSSGEALEMIRAYTKAGIKTHFTYDEKPDGTVIVTAHIGHDASEAQAKAAREEGKRATLEKYYNASMENTKEKRVFTESMAEQFNRQMDRRRRR